MVTPKKEIGQLQDKKVVIINNEPSKSQEHFNSTPIKIEMKMVNGVSTAVEDSIATSSSSGSNHSSSVEHSPNKCILTNNKLEERKQDTQSEGLLNKSENNEVWSSTANLPPDGKS